MKYLIGDKVGFTSDNIVKIGTIVSICVPYHKYSVNCDGIVYHGIDEDDMIEDFFAKKC